MNIDEYYKKWSGRSHLEDSCHPVNDSAATCDFAEYYHAEKTTWEYIGDNVFPENNKKVLCVDNKSNYLIGLHKKCDAPNTFIDSNNKYFYCIAWTELPKLNNFIIT